MSTKQRCKICFGKGYIEVLSQEEEMLLTIAKIHQLTVADLTGRSRTRNVVEARREAARVLSDGGCTIKVVGLLLGGRSHATIRNLLQKKGRSKDG